MASAKQLYRILLSGQAYALTRLSAFLGGPDCIPIPADYNGTLKVRPSGSHQYRIPTLDHFLDDTGD